MGHTATNVLVHFIFSTRHRAPQISPEVEGDLHAYLGGIIRELGGVAVCINGMSDHVHLLVRMPSTHFVADLARLVKDQFVALGSRAMAAKKELRMANRLRSS
jgi:REP element-mobilizing transposase RayT